MIMFKHEPLSEDYQNKLDNILEKPDLCEVAQGLCNLIERADYEKPGDEFWDTASSILFSLPNESFYRALRTEVKRALNSDEKENTLPKRARLIYLVVE